jgi:hypothetical protein
MLSFAPNGSRNGDISETSGVSAASAEEPEIGFANETRPSPRASRTRFSAAMYDYCFTPKYWEFF